MKNGMLSDRKSKDLLLGSIGQLYNMIKYIADKYNISENELLLASKGV